MTIFTDISAAINEARFKYEETGRTFTVVQCNNGEMKVLSDRWVKTKSNIKAMYSTKHDKHHSVLQG